jgi:hypothetical protein
MKYCLINIFVVIFYLLDHYQPIDLFEKVYDFIKF